MFCGSVMRKHVYKYPKNNHTVYSIYKIKILFEFVRLKDPHFPLHLKLRDILDQTISFIPLFTKEK